MTTEKHDFRENLQADDLLRAELRNGLTLYVPQADPYRCHVCGDRETSDRLLIPVLSVKPGNPHWLHRACHDEHIRNLDDRVEAVLACSLSEPS